MYSPPQNFVIKVEFPELDDFPAMDWQKLDHLEKSQRSILPDTQSQHQSPAG